MTREEILKLSGDELRRRALELQGWTEILEDWSQALSPDGSPMVFQWIPDPPNDIAAAMDLFNEIYNPMSKIRGGAWVLGTVDEGKDCSLATLFFGAPSRRARRQGRKNRPLKAQAKTKPKQMARAITLCYVLAMEGATDDLQYQPGRALR